MFKLARWIIKLLKGIAKDIISFVKTHPITLLYALFSSERNIGIYFIIYLLEGRYNAIKGQYERVTNKQLEYIGGMFDDLDKRLTQEMKPISIRVPDSTEEEREELTSKLQSNLRTTMLTED